MTLPWGYFVSSTWHLLSYIRIVRPTCRPFVFCASHRICSLLLMRFYIFMTRDLDNRLPSYPWWAGRALANWTRFHSRSSTSRMTISRLWWRGGGKSHFLNADGSTEFPFSWTGSPSRYKDMGTDELSAVDKEVVEVLMKFTDKLPIKGLVRVYNSVHPIIW